MTANRPPIRVVPRVRQDEPELRESMARHPAGRGRAIGFQLVPLDSPSRLLECEACGTLMRVGSPHLLAHHQAHRRRSWWRRVLTRARRAVTVSPTQTGNR